MEYYEKELKKIEKTVRTNPKGMTITEIAKDININRNSVAKYLDMLLISGHVEMRSIGPAKLYFPSQRVPISAMLNFSSDYIMVLDKDLRVIKTNNNILNLMRAKRDDVIGKKADGIPHTSINSPEMISDLKKALNGKEIKKEMNFPVGTKNFYFIIKLVPTSFEDGSQGVSILAEDITEQKRAEEKLKESEEKYRNILSASPDAITVTDLDAKVIDCNQATLDLHGFSSKKELIGKSAFELIAKKDHKKAVENLKKTSEKGLVKNLVYTFLTKNGREFQAELSASIIKDFSGKPISFVAITKDITKRKKIEERLRESEEKYRMIFELSPEAIGIVDKKGNIVDINGRVYDWLGYKPEEVIGKNIMDLAYITKNSKEKIKESFYNRILGKNVPPYEAEFISKSRKKRIGRILATPIKDSKGEVIGEIVMISDVTRKK